MTAIAEPDSSCRSCGKPVTFARHWQTGNLAPLERDDDAGRWVVEEAAQQQLGDAADDPRTYRPATAKETVARGAIRPLWTNHYATCPQGPAWRAGKGLDL